MITHLPADKVIVKSQETRVFVSAEDILAIVELYCKEFRCLPRLTAAEEDDGLLLVLTL